MMASYPGTSFYAIGKAWNNQSKQRAMALALVIVAAVTNKFNKIDYDLDA